MKSPDRLRSRQAEQGGICNSSYNQEAVPPIRRHVNELPAAALVQATLIRDVNESSVHGDDSTVFSHTPMQQLTELTRDATGPMTIPSNLAVVEAESVEHAPTKTMSRKLICGVIGVLLLVIAALSVGFVVAAQNESDDEESFADSIGNGTGARNGTDIGLGFTTNPNSAQSSSPTADPVPVLHSLQEGGVLWCGVLPGPGLLYVEDGKEEPQGLDASLVRIDHRSDWYYCNKLMSHCELTHRSSFALSQCVAIAAAATGDPARIEFVISIDCS
jgi:hypothetical protein